MSSKAIELDVDFERDVPTTPADIEALWRARQLTPLSDASYLDWLTWLTKQHPASDHITPWPEPFEL
ncbi:MAG TPA: hypothetical protein VJ276_04865 [Thermoanaerobaculia bacterium]|nr:hypothetical protein [Thermoanaerobaculia bacterium]